MPYYSPSTGGFYLKQVHGKNIPADAVEISNRKYDEVMLAQRQGHEIVPTPSGPIIRHAHLVEGAALALAMKSVKREARKRILAIASLERQSNDNATLALEAARRGKGHSTEFLAALERRQKIDAVRAASNAIEAGLAGHTDDELAAFNAASAAWPEA